MVRLVSDEGEDNGNTLEEIHIVLMELSSLERVVIEEKGCTLTPLFFVFAACTCSHHWGAVCREVLTRA